MKKAQTLIMVVVFIVFASLIGLTLAMLVGGSLMMPKYSYNTELAFYAADSGLARAKVILKNCPSWDPNPHRCSGCSSPDYCSILSSKCGHDAGGWYLKETYNIGSKPLYYKIYKSGTSSNPTITVDSGAAMVSSP